jgi:pimeloyl-[acyl-carrier protein] methyl ester esterase
MSLHLETVGQGPDLVLLHGWGMHGGVWGPVLEALAGSFRLHVFDLPGLGYSGSITPYTLEKLAGAVAEAAPYDTAVCGWSLGGQVALRWALERPQQIGKLVLVGTTPRFVSGSDWPHGVDDNVFCQFADQVRQDYHGTLSRFLALQAHGGDASKETIRNLREHFFERGEPDAEMLQGGLEILLAADMRADIGGINIPALVLHGDYDRLVPVAAGRWLAQQLPSARMQVCEGASHAPFLSHPTWFVGALKKFLLDG